MKRNVFSATSATDERCQIAVGHGANERNAGGDIGYCTRRSPKPSRHARGGGPTIKLVVQLAQSPDTNGCDLGLFRSVDTHIPKFRPFELDAFARMVSKAHQQCPGDNVERLYETKIVVCKKLAETEGDNSFDLHHRKKSA